MLSQTLKLLRAAMDTDPTLTPADRSRLMAAIRSGGVLKSNGGPAVDRVLGFPEAADRISKTPRYLHGLAKAGVLQKVTVPGKHRAIGFRESDIQALIAGTVPAAVPSTEAA